MADELNRRIVEAAGYDDVTQHTETVQTARVSRCVSFGDEDDDAASFVSCEDFADCLSLCGSEDADHEEKIAALRDESKKVFAVQAAKATGGEGTTVTAEFDSQCSFSIFPRSKVRLIREWPCVSHYVEAFGSRAEAVTTTRGLACFEYPAVGGGSISVVQERNVTDAPDADLLIHVGAVDRFDSTAVVRSNGGKFVRVGLQPEFDPQGVYPFRASTRVRIHTVSKEVPACAVALLANAVIACEP
uniref:Uncharacterized protein n=1 Tax=Chromera velia CCMP2878 TaxID=1169474 RepID=A0A0G4G4X3_9ALVE|eukprot:Cvel_20218.t1-p1 / transcript=Cvel_20218.t1 / gene=Cvel_20218 / organism=Chromera_velia_CCMP2878 / gene_product=hypothetical protein / transcript_product=hypothetical protein / location=Cvel_scaffold1799:37391-38122(+) / protein_length=244 / sequence_SO=supercontig / SO=protein_coding / is_pseudo=false